ncbi:GNAT family N-acetyltransferase [Nocardioides sp. GCM10027113]|uniref:GNAT family N-acetyltransferase n=1 Tax=unclassified Nocardioides TaxID=2615069 RepID=UPI0036232187
MELSTDPARLDVDRIHHWLSTDAYWSLGRSRDVVERAIAGSLNVGAYVDGEQVGYARVVTDRATFAWLCDVYVAPDHRGSGVGTALLERVAAELEGLQLKRVLLATADAHDLYRRFGFEPLAHPERFMATGHPDAR